MRGQLSPTVERALERFAHRFGLDAKDARTFECFAGYHVLRHLDVDAFEPDDVHMGGADDNQIDCLAIIINNEVVTSVEQLSALAEDYEDGGPFEVMFVLVQATTSENFSQDKVATFHIGAMNFFAQSSRLPQSPKLIAARALKDAVFATLERLGIEQRPVCRTFAFWPGDWSRNEYPTGVGVIGAEALGRGTRFSGAQFTPIDGRVLAHLIEAEAIANSAELAFSGFTPVEPAPATVDVSLLGYCRATALLDLVSETDALTGELRLKRAVFHENVRYFLGLERNAVNQQMQFMLEAGSGSEFFLRNNGIVIVAKSADDLGQGRFRLTDYQVVNGCQTSSLLFTCRSHLNDAVLVPVKLVVTRNQDTITGIIDGANRSTQIADHDFLGREPYVRRFKQHIDAINDGHPRRPIFFERRVNEHAAERADPEQQHWVISVRELTEAFASAFLVLPHFVHDGQWAVLRKRVNATIFADAHDMNFYLAAGLALGWSRCYIAELPSSQSNYPARHQLVYAIRLLAEPPKGLPKDFHGPWAASYSARLVASLSDPAQAMAVAREAGELVAEAAREIDVKFTAAAARRITMTRAIERLAAARSRR